MPNMPVAADRDQTSRVDTGITAYCLRARMTAIAFPKPNIKGVRLAWAQKLSLP